MNLQNDDKILLRKPQFLEVFNEMKRAIYLMITIKMTTKLTTSKIMTSDNPINHYRV